MDEAQQSRKKEYYMALMGPMAVLRRHLFDPTSEERKRLKNKIFGVFMGMVQLWGFTVEMALVVHAKIFISKIVEKRTPL